MVDCPASHGIFFWGGTIFIQCPCFAMFRHAVGSDDQISRLGKWQRNTRWMSLDEFGEFFHTWGSKRENPSCWFMYAWMYLISICTYMYVHIVFQYHTDVHTWFNLFTSELEPNEIYRTWCVSTRIISLLKLLRCFQVFSAMRASQIYQEWQPWWHVPSHCFFLLSAIRKSQDMYILMQWYILSVSLNVLCNPDD